MNEIRREAACVGNGVCGVEVDRKDIPMNKLVATTLEHLMHVYDVRTQHPDEGFACKRVNTKVSTTWSAKHLPQVAPSMFGQRFRTQQGAPSKPVQH